MEHQDHSPLSGYESFTGSIAPANRLDGESSIPEDAISKRAILEAFGAVAIGLSMRAAEKLREKAADMAVRIIRRV